MAAFKNWCIFRKKSGRQSSAGPEILAFVSHCSANLQLILDCFIPKFKLKYENLENINIGRVNTFVFNLHQSKRRAFWDTRYSKCLSYIEAHVIAIVDLICSFKNKWEHAFS